jgi:hypothetical protein
MQRLSEDITQYFQAQGFVILSTIDKDGKPHAACKGIVKISKKGFVYLLDLYKGRTYENLQHNPRASITVVDEHKFTGYCLKGKARIIKREKCPPDIMSAWENKIISRITQRVIKNIRGEKGHTRHPETFLPMPEYMILVKIDKIIDLTPHHIKSLPVQGGKGG